MSKAPQYVRVGAASRVNVFALAVLGIAAASRPARCEPVPSPAAEAASPEKSVKPSPRQSPDEVVGLQMRVLSGAGEVQARIQRCYQFASPANRLYTGPLERFAGMVKSPPYSAMLNARHFLVGRAATHGDEAHLLLTVVDDNNELRMFRCFLSKQSADPYKGCWMTDAVVPVGVANPPQQLREPSPPSI